MHKIFAYHNQLANLGLTEKQFAALKKPVRIYISFGTPPLATYKKLTPPERQKKFKEHIQKLFQKITEKYNLARCLDFPSKNGVLLALAADVPAHDVAKIAKEPGVSYVHILKTELSPRTKLPATRLFSVSAYTEMWIENKTKPVRFEEELYLVQATNEKQALDKIKKELKITKAPTIDPVYDTDFHLCEWRLKHLEVVASNPIEKFSLEHSMCVATHTATKPFKQWLN